MESLLQSQTTVIGRNIVSRKFVLCKDSGHILVPVEDEVELHSIQGSDKSLGGQYIHSLTLERATNILSIDTEQAHTQHIKANTNMQKEPSKDTVGPLTHDREKGNVRSVVFDPKNPLQVYVAHEHGLVVLWDFMKAVPLKHWRLSSQISHLVVDKDHRSFFVLCTKYKSKGSGKAGPKYCVFRHSLTKEGSEALLFKCKTHIPFLLISADSANLAFYSENKIYLIHIKSQSCKIIETPRKITSLALHPQFSYCGENQCLAVGNITGQIALMYLSPNSQTQTAESLIAVKAKTVLHWHAHAVSDLAFTSDAHYLLSGGEESVLVIWPILGHQPQEYLPRIGGRILSLAASEDGRLYALSTSDNTIRIFDAANLEKKAAIVGLKALQSASVLLTGLVISRDHYYLAVNSLPGCIQIWDPTTRSSVLEMEISPQNVVSKMHDTPIKTFVVTHVDFGQEWMATVDARDDPQYTEVYLRFWAYDGPPARWRLYTRLDFPHQDQLVTCIKFAHSEPGLCVSTGMDGQFKVWSLHETLWTCKSVAFYKQHTIPNQCEFSTDDSLLAVSFVSTSVSLTDSTATTHRDPPCITLWDPNTMTLLHVFSQPTVTEPLLHEQTSLNLEAPPWQKRLVSFEFIKNAPYPSMAIVYHNKLIVWDLALAVIKYSYSFPVNAGRFTELLLSCHPKKAYFVVAYTLTKDVSPRTFVILFGMDSNRPLAIHESAYSVLHIRFWIDEHDANCGSGPATFRIVYVDSNSNLKLLKFGRALLLPRIHNHDENMKHHLTSSKHDSGVSVSSTSELNVKRRREESPKRTKSIKPSTFVTDTYASHLLPPMSILFNLQLKAFSEMKIDTLG